MFYTHFNLFNSCTSVYTYMSYYICVYIYICKHNLLGTLMYINNNSIVNCITNI